MVAVVVKVGIVGVFLVLGSRLYSPMGGANPNQTLPGDVLKPTGPSCRLYWHVTSAGWDDPGCSLRNYLMISLL